MARESKETVREKILAAAEARFWRYGIKKTTIDEIAADADIGKGSVYLHFDSKEEIAIAIIADYKERILSAQEQTAADISVPIVDRLKKVLTLPIESACINMRESPMMVETVLAVKMQGSSRFRGLIEREVGLIVHLLQEANEAGEMHVRDCERTARLIKNATLQYMPTAINWAPILDPGAEISDLVNLLYSGLR